MSDAPSILHWYDLTCPFCYLAQARNDALAEHGVVVDELGFSAHPDLPADGLWLGHRQGAMYDLIAREAAASGLPLRWQDKLPNSRTALAAVERVRTGAPASAPPFRRALFHAHFAGGRDIGSRPVVLALAAETGVPHGLIEAGWADGAAFAELDESQRRGRAAGVTGTPAWAIGGQVVTGLQPLARLLAMLRGVRDA